MGLLSLDESPPPIPLIAANYNVIRACQLWLLIIITVPMACRSYALNTRAASGLGIFFTEWLHRNIRYLFCHKWNGYRYARYGICKKLSVRSLFKQTSVRIIVNPWIVFISCTSINVNKKVLVHGYKVLALLYPWSRWVQGTMRITSPLYFLVKE